MHTSLLIPKSFSVDNRRIISRALRSSFFTWKSSQHYSLEDLDRRVIFVKGTSRLLTVALLGVTVTILPKLVRKRGTECACVMLQFFFNDISCLFKA